MHVHIFISDYFVKYLKLMLYFFCDLYLNIYFMDQGGELMMSLLILLFSEK